MKTLPLRRRISLLLVLCIAFALGCVGCGGASAATMFLRKTEGTVAVADAEGADVVPAENLGLYSGYTVGTEAESYAWIDLDQVKLTKLDESSAAAITKDGKNLFIDVISGSLFFHVTQPLAEDETMEIRTSSMLAGIRGTCGWVEVPDSSTMRVYLLEGQVECTAGENTATVNAGEMAEMTADGTIEVSAYTAWDIPDFVTEEIKEDEALREVVPAASDIDAAGSLQSIYPDVFDGSFFSEPPTGEILFAEEIDFEADGSPELLVIFSDGETYEFSFFRKGTGGSEHLSGRVTSPESGMKKISLVESGGRLYVLEYQETNSADRFQWWYHYWGSKAQNDGDRSSWGRIEGASSSNSQESEAVIAKYTEVRVLVEA